MADGEGDEVKARVEEAKIQIGKLRTDLHDNSIAYDRVAQRLWRYDVVLRTILVLFSVAGPTVVTYASQVTGANKESWMITAILLTSFAGAATSIQAIWGFGDRHKLCLTTSLALR